MFVKLIDPYNEDLANYQLYKTAYAMTTCTMNEENLDKNDIEKHKKLIQTLIDKGHTSVLEHINYTFEICDITRALLQEISRHRHTSPTVQSTRWALKKMDNKYQEAESSGGNTYDINKFIHIPSNLESEDYERYIKVVKDMLQVRAEFSKKYGNDTAKYLTPECIYTKEILTVNARSLLNMFELRTSHRALEEFRTLMRAIYIIMPQNHKFIYEKVIENNKNEED